jgi:iron complex transport system ATP-binding protein
MKTPGPILQVQDLQVRREIPILQDIQWTVQPGEHWVLLGPNGSGKTTLLNSLTGFMPATAGSISLLGATYGKSDWRKLRKKVGWVSPTVAGRIEDREPAVAAVLSGRKAMINYWGALKEEELKEAGGILREIGCEHLAERPWAYLSQGERQRVLIGRALMAKYQLLLLDEPCAGLDMVAREEFLHFLDGLLQKKQVPTLVLVTHHVEEITPSFTHVLLLKAGRVFAQGDKAEVLNSANLSQVFAREIELKTEGDRYVAHLGGFPPVDRR